MKESKKKHIRKIYNWVVWAVVAIGFIVGYTLCPIAKLLGYFPEMTWKDALVPAMFTTGIQVIWLFGWFSWWIMKEGEK